MRGRLRSVNGISITPTSWERNRDGERVLPNGGGAGRTRSQPSGMPSTITGSSCSDRCSFPSKSMKCPDRDALVLR